MSGPNRAERVARALALIACAWFAFTAFWGINAQPHAGHIGSAGAAIAMTAENSIRWHSFYPLMGWYEKTNGFPQSAYCHHPFGCFWVSEIAVWLFDHADFVPNLPSAIMSAITPVLIYKTAKRAWGAIPGAAAALAFVTLPITVGFSIFHNLEVITIFGAVLFFYGHGEYMATRRRRDLMWSLLGVAFAGGGDWAGYLIMAPLLGWALMRAFVLPTWMTPPIKPLPYHRWWALSVALAVGTAVLWIVMFKHADKLTEWVASAESRGGGADQKLAAILEARKTWIDFSFTWVAIFFGKLALPVAAVRLLWIRRDAEMYSLAMLFGATAQYLMFKQGADVHIFWPHYFGAYYAYAIGQLVATVGASGRWIGSRFLPGSAATFELGAALAMLAMTTLPQAPDAVRSLKIWRGTAGKYDDKGTLFRSQADVLHAVKKVIRPRLQSGERLGVHSSSAWGWEHQWALEGLDEGAEAPSGADPFWIARASGLGADRIKDLAQKHHLRLYGDTVIVERGDPPAPIDAYAVDEREPNLMEWMFTNNNEPVRTISQAPDPFLTWEWRVHYDQPADLPKVEAKTLEQIRIAHNVAVSQGDQGTAARLLTQLRDAVDRTVEAHFSGGHELIGVRVTHGVRPQIDVYFQAGGATAGDTTFTIRSDIVAKAPFSLIPQSPVECDLAYPPPLSTKTWKPGFVYKFTAPLHHRIGRERYWGAWAGGATRLHGDAKVDLAYED